MRLPAVLARIDWWALLVAIAIAMVGSAFVRSATLEDAKYAGLSVKHALILVIALGSGVAVLSMPYARVMRGAWLLYAIALLALLALPYFGITINGAQRWYRLPGFAVQPSEPAKLAVILALASYLRFRSTARTFEGLLVPLMIAGIPALLVMRQPDLGSALVFGPVALAMCFAAGTPARSVVWTLVLAAVIAVLGYFVLHDYQRERVDAWLGHFEWHDSADSGSAEVRAVLRGSGYQPWQSLIAIGGGGLLGFGYAEGPQNRYGFLPYRYDDYIFAVVAEETGFVGACTLLALYALLFARLLAIALRTRERFGRLLVVGVAVYFATQALVHAAVCMWLIPATGLPMPLVSYGGSSTVVSVWALALALSVGARSEPVLSSDGFA